ncbi:MAG: hypothetical protein U0T80_03880 [Flavobacteriaceae bacterium]
MYIAGAAIPALPLVSNSSITGTWFPALNNTTSSNYTFTPDSGQCASNFNLSISIIPNTTPTINIVRHVTQNSVTV